MPEVTQAPPTPKEVNQPDFQFLPGRTVLAHRISSMVGRDTPNGVDVGHFTAALRLPENHNGVVYASGEFAHDDVQERDRAWADRQRKALVFNGLLEDQRELDWHTNNYIIRKALDKVGEHAFSHTQGKEEQAQGNEEQPSWALYFLEQDLGIGAYQPGWSKATANGDTWWDPYLGREVGAESRVGRLDFVYHNDASHASAVVIANSRARSERFMQNHGETVKAAVDKFPELAQQLFTNLGLKIDQETFMRRYEEIKDRVMVVSYLDEVMPAFATGVYNPDSRSIALSADYLVDKSKESVEQIVFHELFHGVAARYYLSCEESGTQDVDPGVPHSRWLMEGITEYLAQEMQKLHSGVDAANRYAYKNEVDIVKNIIEANPAIKKLLLEGNFTGLASDGRIEDLKIHQAIAAIEHVYGSGFTKYVEGLLGSDLKADDEKIDRVKDYTKKLKIAAKAKKAVILLAGSASLVAGVAVGVEKVADHFYSEGYNDAKAEEQFSKPILWQDISPADVSSAIELNTMGAAEVNLGVAEGGVLDIRTGDEMRRFADPIYFEGPDDKNYAVVDVDGRPQIFELGTHQDYQALIMFAEDGSIHSSMPVIKDGKLMDAITEDEIGYDITAEYRKEQQRLLKEAQEKARQAG